MKKVVILGPESTGKSTLSQQLAAHYHTLACPEYAREYLLTNGKEYTYNQLLTIAKGQIALEEEYLNKTSLLPNKPQLLFIDTDMYVMKVWCEYVFHQCHRFILDNIVTRQYDLYLLCNIDLPWEKDELREYPDISSRQELMKIYQDLMVNQQVPWVLIKGSETERFHQAVMAVEQLK